MVQKNSLWEKFNKKVKKGDITWWQMDLPSGNILFGKEKALMLGRNPQDFIVYQDFTSLLHKDDYEAAMKAMRDAMRGKKKFYETTYRIKNAKGRYVRFYDIGKIVHKHKEKMTAIGFVIKITSKDEITYYSKLIKKTADFSQLVLKIIT